MAQDYYEILQVHPRADAEAIEAAYARLRALYDPERLAGAADELLVLARERRDAIDRAYAVLSDPQRRAQYDAELAESSPAPAVPQSEAATLAEPVFDYRPLPPARRAERPRGFDNEPVVRSTKPGGRAPQAQPGGQPLAPILIVVGTLVMVTLAGLLLTGGGQPPVAQPTATPSMFDQLEGFIPQARQAAEQAGDDPQLWINLGNLLYDSVQIVREQSPGSPLYEQRQSRWLEASEAYSRALQLEPDNAAARADYGASLCFYGEDTGEQSYVAQGLAAARQAVQDAPEEPRALLSLGYCLVRQETPEVDQAIESWRQIIELEPDSPLANQARLLIEEYSR